MPNLIKQFGGDIAPAPEARPRGGSKKKKSSAEEDPVKDKKTDFVAQGQAILDTAFEQSDEILASARERSVKQHQEIMEQARREAERIKREAQEQGIQEGIEKGREEGRAEGWQAGFTEGVKTAEEANEGVLQELKALLEGAALKTDDLLARNEADLIALATAIARKIIQRELAATPEIIHDILLNAVSGYRGEEFIRVTVTPETARTLLRTNNSVVQALKEISQNIKIIPSPSMQEGGCQIELPETAIDAGVEAQLSKIEQSLRG